MRIIARYVDYWHVEALQGRNEELSISSNDLQWVHLVPKFHHKRRFWKYLKQVMQ